MAEYHSLNHERSAHWLRNCVRYRAARTLPRKRDSHLWIFSAWEGEKYGDNAKYLFEHIREFHPSIQCIWQTKNRELYGEMTRQGIPVQLLGTAESRRTQKRAGVAVFTNGIDDFGYGGEVFGAVLICLWHGFGFKQGFRQIYRNPQPLLRFLSNLKWDLFSWLKRDLTIVVSEYTREQFAKMFRLKEKRDVLISGQARYDALRQPSSLRNAVHPSQIPQDCTGKRVILYMPTFRNEAGRMLQIVREILASSQIREVLENHQAVLLCKLHYLSAEPVQGEGPFILLQDSDVTLTQQLLASSDLLITDYSSCAVDYSLLRRPEIFYCPDLEEYQHKGELIPEYSALASLCSARTPSELAAVLTEVLSVPDRGILQAQRVHDFFFESGISIGSFAQHNYECITQRLYEKYGFQYLD